MSYKNTHILCASKITLRLIYLVLFSYSTLLTSTNCKKSSLIFVFLYLISEFCQRCIGDCPSWSRISSHCRLVHRCRFVRELSHSGTYTIQNQDPPIECHIKYLFFSSRAKSLCSIYSLYYIYIYMKLYNI